MTPYAQTPGPWAIDWTLSDGDRYWVEAKPGDAPIVVARVNEMRDAQLIAAAPELLAALQEMTEQYERLLIESRITKRDADTMRSMLPHYTGAARELIAKATGEKA